MSSRGYCSLTTLTDKRQRVWEPGFSFCLPHSLLIVKIKQNKNKGKDWLVSIQITALHSFIPWSTDMKPPSERVCMGYRCRRQIIHSQCSPEVRMSADSSSWSFGQLAKRWISLQLAEPWRTLPLPSSLLAIFWCDFSLFVDHYFGHWHVGVLLFGFFNGLSQGLAPVTPHNGKTKRRRDGNGELYVLKNDHVDVIYTKVCGNVECTDFFCLCLLKNWLSPHYRKMIKVLDLVAINTQSRAHSSVFCEMLNLKGISHGCDSHLIMVNVCIPRDDNSLLDPRFWDAALHSLTENQRAVRNTAGH